MDMYPNIIKRRGGRIGSIFEIELNLIMLYRVQRRKEVPAKFGEESSVMARWLSLLWTP